MRPKVWKQRVRAAAVASVLVVPLSLTACAESEHSASSGGEGVEFGASKEAYLKAFEDIEPIKLRSQTPAPKGSLTGARNEAYLAAVEEWSGGKITFEVGYSNAFAPPEESDDALNDGRLDVVNVMPVYEPSAYPANVALNDVSFIGRQTPLVGILSAHAWMLDANYDTPAMAEELKQAGVHALMPFNSGHSYMICSDQRTGLSDFDGAQVLSGGTTQGHQIKALGATPLSIPYTEVFESLQRGIADCTVSSLLGVDLGGYAAVANNVTYGPDSGYAITTGILAVGENTWESLPLVAQQLLFDRTDVFLEASVAGTWGAMASAIDAIVKAGGSFAEYDADAGAKLAEKNNSLLNDLRASKALPDADAFVDSAAESSTAWLKTITEDLGYEDVASFEDFAEMIQNDPPDLSAYTEAVFAQVMLPHRPA